MGSEFREVRHDHDAHNVCDLCVMSVISDVWDVRDSELSMMSETSKLSIMSLMYAMSKISEMYEMFVKTEISDKSEWDVCDVSDVPVWLSWRPICETELKNHSTLQQGGRLIVFNSDPVLYCTGTVDKDNSAVHITDHCVLCSVAKITLKAFRITVWDSENQVGINKQ